MVNEHRMLARSDEVLLMAVVSFQGINQAHENPRAVIEGLNVTLISAGARLDFLHPAVGAAVQNLERPERWQFGVTVDPTEQIPIGGLDRQHLGFVDQPDASGEVRSERRASLPGAGPTRQHPA